MNARMQRRALAAREAHIALLDLKAEVEEVARTIQDAEFEAAYHAIRSETEGESATKVRAVLERLDSSRFETTLVKARQSLQKALA